MKTNEPVALMHPTYKNRILPIDAPYANVGTSDWIPLYTHPAKTLTDEEILDICIMGGFYDRIDDPFFDKKTGAWSLDEDLIQFARAILRKAQEK